MCVWAPNACMPGAHGGQKKVSDHLELVVSRHVDSEIRLWVLWKCSVLNHWAISPAPVCFHTEYKGFAPPAVVFQIKP